MDDFAACTACAALCGRIGDAFARAGVGFGGVGEDFLERQART
jgi:UDP-glucose 6-dehydrogenase